MRRGAPQPDLFSVPQAPAAPKALPPAIQAVPPRRFSERLPSRPKPWRELLRETCLEDIITLAVNLRWTGEVVEVLAAGAEARWFLFRDGRIDKVAPDPGMRARIVYVSPETAGELHVQWGLIRMADGGTHGALYRFAEAGEFAPPELRLPDGDADG